MDSTVVDQNQNQTMPDDMDRAEREALGRIAHAFREYRVDAEWEIARWEYNYNRLSDAHKSLVPNFPAKIAAARQCIYQNHLFIKSMLASFTPDSDPPAPPTLAQASAAAEEWSIKVNNRVNPADADKVRYVLKNLMRDWSAEGAAEREQSYGRICKELQRLFPHMTTNDGSNSTLLAPLETVDANSNANSNGSTIDSTSIHIENSLNQPSIPAAPIVPNNDIIPQSSKPPPAVLIPGTGLARLAADIASLGFYSIGNEFSYYMLLTSTYILNNTEHPQQWAIHPWIHNSCNNKSDADQLRPVHIPDIMPIDLGCMSMVAGDFVEVFSHPDYEAHFDAVVTCFFIDTAHNVIEYLETIWRCLKPGGVWINFGPLLWHWADAHTYLQQDAMSLELSVRDVERIAQQIGFRLERKEIVKAAYMSNERSLLRQEYDCVFWTARKPVGFEG